MDNRTSAMQAAAVRTMLNTAAAMAGSSRGRERAQEKVYRIS